jgi:hypothetical protein
MILKDVARKWLPNFVYLDEELLITLLSDAKSKLDKELHDSSNVNFGTDVGGGKGTTTVYDLARLKHLDDLKNHFQLEPCFDDIDSLDIFACVAHKDKLRFKRNGDVVHGFLIIGSTEFNLFLKKNNFDGIFIDDKNGDLKNFGELKGDYLIIAMKTNVDQILKPIAILNEDLVISAKGVIPDEVYDDFRRRRKEVDKERKNAGKRLVGWGREKLTNLARKFKSNDKKNVSNSKGTGEPFDDLIDYSFFDSSVAY